MENKGIQQMRLEKVLKVLKERGITQKEIAVAIGADEGTLSSLKSGKVKNVHPEISSALEEKYAINPYYISGESEMMFTQHLKELKHFDQFVKKWGTVEGSEQKYLHLSLDKNFYDFLIEVNAIRLAEAEGILAVSDQIRDSAHLHTAEPDFQEFVLLPRNNFLEILGPIKKGKKEFEEVMDLLEYDDYPEPEETT